MTKSVLILPAQADSIETLTNDALLEWWWTRPLARRASSANATRIRSAHSSVESDKCHATAVDSAFESFTVGATDNANVKIR